MYQYDKDEHERGDQVELALDERARWVQIHTPSDIYPLFAKLADWMRVFEFTRLDIFAVRLALHEAVANAMRYGNRNDPNKHIVIRYLITPGEAFTEVRDQGPGFDPRAVPDPLLDENIGRPLGRGIFLMRAYSSWVRFNAQGNQVTMGRRRTVC